MHEACFSCTCRKCDYLKDCDIGDMAPAHPCSICKGSPYLTGDCTLQSAKDDQKIKPADVVAAFNAICLSLPQVKKITDQRRKAIRARKATLEEFEAVFMAAESSDFLSGRNKKWGGCSFDWLLKPNNWQRVREGVYSKSFNQVPKATNYPQRQITEEELSHIITNLDETAG